MAHSSGGDGPQVTAARSASADLHDQLLDAAGALGERLHPGGGLGLAVAVDDAAAEVVGAGLGAPGEVPLAPVVVAGRRPQPGVLPGPAVDLHLDLRDAAVLLGPGDAADEGVTGGDRLEHL